MHGGLKKEKLNTFYQALCLSAYIDSSQQLKLTPSKTCFIRPDPAKMSGKNTSLTAGKILLIVLLLYIFICSLDLMSVSFRLIAGKAAGKDTVFYDSVTKHVTS